MERVVDVSDQAVFPAGRLAGIDYGSVRIGVAVTDSRRTLASPHAIYQRRHEAADASYFQALVEIEKLVGFVVGLPVHLDGRESQKSGEARRFGAWLTRATKRPVVYFDERFTTAEANQFLSDSRLTKKQRAARRDKLAAQILLSAYLESSRGGDPGSIDDYTARGLK